MIILKNTNYLFGRAASIIFRPLVLFVYINFASIELSNKLSIIYIISVISVIFTSFSTHRNFYKSGQFKNLEIETNHDFKEYYASMIGIVIFGIFINLIVSSFYLKNSYLVISCLLVFLVDRIYDEVQRFFIVTQQFSKWGTFSLYRSISFIISFILPLLIFENYLNIFVSSIFYLFIFILIIFVSVDVKNIKFANLSSFKFVYEHIKFLYISILSASIAYVDRIFFMIIESDQLAYLTLFSSIFAIIPVFVNFFYISNNLSNFVKNKITFKQIILDYNFWLIVGLSSLISWVVVFFLFMISKSVNNIDILNSNYYTIFLIYLISTMTALGSLSVTKIYWSKNFIYISYIDSFFWLSTILIFYYLQDKYIKIEFSILILFILYLFRNIFLIRLPE